MTTKTAAWVSASIETIVDAGGWDTLTPLQQAHYVAQQEELARWRRTWRGRLFDLRLRLGLVR